MKKKILTMQFRHETNSFCPAPADEKAYRNTRFLVGDEIFPDQRKIGTETGAFLKVFDAREDIELIPTVALNATPSGPVTADVYDFVCREVSRVIETQGPFDGALLECHGAMVAQGHPDGEGDLFEMMRNLMGWEIPIVATLDLHANVTEKMARCATALIPFEKYPHTDSYDTGLFAARLLEDTLDQKLRPVMAYRKIPFLLPLFPTDSQEMQPLYDFAHALEKRPGIRCARFCHGFFPSDIEEMGMSVLVIADGDESAARQAADELAQAIEEAIPHLKIDYPTLDEALDLSLLPSDRPLVLADSSDNPGAGGLGDTTHILRRILERGITGAAIANIVDPQSVEICEKAGVGQIVHLSLGGHSDAAYSGGPVEADAYIQAITDGKYRYTGKMFHGIEANHGKTAVLKIAGNTVLLSSLPKQPLDPEVFLSQGVNPYNKRILVVKSSIHYRAAFGPIAREMIALALPGYSVPTPHGYCFKHKKDQKM